MLVQKRPPSHRSASRLRCAPGSVALISLAAALLLTAGCQTGGARQAPPTGQKSIEAMPGETMDALIEQFGMPDSIEPVPYSSKKTEGEPPSLMLTYEALKKRVYVSQQRIVLSVVPVKQ